MIPGTLPEVLRMASENYAGHGIGFIRPDHSINFQTYSGLEREATLILAGLQHIGISKGEMVILSLDTNEEIIPVLWSCFMGGIIPVLLQPPVSLSGYNPAAEKAQKVSGILGNPKVILSPSHAEAWRFSNIPERNMIDIADVPGISGPPLIPDLHPDDIALIQFSSGSTGDPKGVILTHRNILYNLKDISHGIRLTAEDISVSWMPLYHDMGLIGFHFTPTYAFVTQYLIEPVEFVKNPFLWLDILSEKKCTITGSPNFGQVLVNRYLNRKHPGKLDLSAIRVLFNGAEPISIHTMNEFITGLLPFGLRPESMLPAYGMAEATLAVTFSPLHGGAEIVSFDRDELLRKGRAIQLKENAGTAVQLVNVGKPLDHCSVMISDENGNPLEEGIIGHVRVKGESITRGYYNNPVLTLQSFSGEWFHTGDMGFIVNGDLFITGRSKDIIFINGMNYYSHDLEDIAIQVDDVTNGKIVVAGYFNEEEGRDNLVVFLVGHDNDSIRKKFMAIRNHLMKTIGLTPEIFIPVRSDDIPRTGDGKIQRYKMVSRFLNGEFPKVLRI